MDTIVNEYDNDAYDPLANTHHLKMAFHSFT